MFSAPINDRYMVGDLCMVDEDGDEMTIGDRYFGTISEIMMKPREIAAHLARRQKKSERDNNGSWRRSNIAFSPGLS